MRKYSLNNYKNVGAAIVVLLVRRKWMLFFAAGAIAPFVTPKMLQDFISCGGVLTIVAGMRVSGIKQYPIANMIPALLLVLPASAAGNANTAVQLSLTLNAMDSSSRLL